MDSESGVKYALSYE